MTGQTLDTEVERERKVFVTAYGNFASINVGDVVEIGEERRPELITHKTPIEVGTYEGTISSLFRDSKTILLVQRLYTENYLDGYTIKGRYCRDSTDIAEQRIHQALDQLLNEHGIRR